MKPMRTIRGLSELRVLIRGGGDLGSGVAWRLHHCRLKVAIMEVAQPLAVRRTVSFCEAVYRGKAVVEGVEAVLVQDAKDFSGIWAGGKIPVLVDPHGESLPSIQPDVLVDAILAKRNLVTSPADAPLVMALGPGFEAGRDAHFVVETNRGHHLGRLIAIGAAEPNTGVPGAVQGITEERVLRAPARGLWENRQDIGDMVKKGDTIGFVEGQEAAASIDGIIRGLIHPGISVKKGMKIGDIDPRGIRQYCYTISEKALALGGGVLEGIMRTFGQ
jgi:xanthine dehydrogenase accessory factor